MLGKPHLHVRILTKRFASPNEDVRSLTGSSVPHMKGAFARGRHTFYSNHHRSGHRDCYRRPEDQLHLRIDGGSIHLPALDFGTRYLTGWGFRSASKLSKSPRF